MNQTNSSYSGSAFRKTVIQQKVLHLQDDYDDEPYEMVQEPYEGEKYPSVDDISPSHQQINDQYRKKEPKSPTFKHETLIQQTSQQSHSMQTIGQVSNSVHIKEETKEQEYIKQLTRKVKKQAEQLMHLENYKILCERKIKELTPNHPLPIEPNHLGNNEFLNFQIQELLRALKAKDDELIQLQGEQKSLSLRTLESHSSSQEFAGKDHISSPTGEDGSNLSYNSLISKYKTLLNEKVNLEALLRTEINANEEQRAYIEVLKSMLDDRFDTLAISQWLGGLPTNDKIDVLLEMKHLTDELRRAEQINEEFRMKYEEQENELQRVRDENQKIVNKNQKLIEENVNLNQTYIKLNQNVKSFEEEIKKIEEEKNNLIDYADEKDRRFENLNNDFHELREKYETLVIQNEDLSSKFEIADNELTKYSSCFDIKNRSQDKLKKLENEYQRLKSENYQSGPHSKNSIEFELRQSLELFKNNIEQIKKEGSNLLREKEKQIDRLNKEIETLESELRLAQDKIRQDDTDYKNKLYRMKTDFDNSLERLETKVRNYERNELNLKGQLDKGNLDLENLKEKLTISIEEKKKVELDAKDLREQVERLTVDLSQLKYKQGDIEWLKTEMNEKVQTLQKELAQSKEETSNYQKKVDELLDTQNLLQKKFAQKEDTVSEFESFYTESKEKFEKDSKSKSEELRRLYDENSSLRHEIRSLKENYTRALTSINLKEEEINILRSHLEKKNLSYQAMLDENRIIRQRLDDIGLMKDQVEFLRNEKERNVKEIKDYEELIDNKNSTLRNTLHKLENVEQEIYTLTNELKQANLERDEMISENLKMKKRIIDLEETERIMRGQCDEKEEKIGRLLKEGDKMQKQVMQLTHDLQLICNEQQQTQNEREFIKQNQDKERKIIERSVEISYNVVNLLQEKFLNIAKLIEISGEKSMIFSQQFKDLVQKPDFIQKVYDKDYFLPQMIEYISDSIKIIIEEIDNLTRRVVDIKQDLMISNQRINLLEKKCLNLTTDEVQLREKETSLRREIELLKEINTTIPHVSGDDMKYFRENSELKKENLKLHSELSRLREEVSFQSRQQLIQARLSVVTFRKRDGLNTSLELVTADDELKMLSREKKNLEEIIDKLSNLFGNPELKKSTSSIIKLQSEIDNTERAKHKLEENLTETEMEYKLLNKKGNSPSKASNLRSDIEEKRNELNNLSAQLEILRKRRGILFEELRSFEIIEKKRYENGIETEKHLIEAKRELEEIKYQKQGLENMTGSLKETVKNISKEKQQYLAQQLMKIRVLDYENLKLKYSLDKDNLENNQNLKNNSLYQKNENKKNFGASNQGLTHQFAQITESLAKPEGSYTERNYSGRLHDGSTSFYSEKKSSVEVKYIEKEQYSQIKLKDRLNQVRLAKTIFKSQAKSVLSSIKKDQLEN